MSSDAKSCITLTTAIGQRFCGLHMDRVDGFGLSVLALPKAWEKTWETRLQSKLPHVHVDDASAMVVLHEGQKVTIEVRGPFAKALVKQSEVRHGLEKQRVKQERDEAPQQSPAGKSSVDTGEESTESLQDSEEAKLRMLVRVRYSTEKEKEAYRRGKERSADTKPAEMVLQSLTQGMLALLELKHRLGRDRDVPHDLDASEQWGALVDSLGKEIDPALLLLAQKRFVDGMQRKLRHIRRGYVPTVAREAVIRGRITQRGILQAEMGEPSVECAYDEFSETTPLFRILVTALDHVAMGAGATRYGFHGWSLWQDVHKTALRVRRQLAPIPSLPFAVAARRAGQLRLPRMLRTWRPLLDLARVLLRDDSPRGAAPQGVSCSFQWRISTAHLWEDWLRRAVQDGQGAEARPLWVVERNKVENIGEINPWEGLGKAKRVDLLLSDEDESPAPAVQQQATEADATTRGRRLAVVDAKYKKPPTTPSPADQYQIWFYSLAYANVCAASLVYPQMQEPSDANSEPSDKCWPRWSPPALKGGANPVRLHMLAIPFPPPPFPHKEGNATEPGTLPAWDSALQQAHSALASIFP